MHKLQKIKVKVFCKIVKNYSAKNIYYVCVLLCKMVGNFSGCAFCLQNVQLCFYTATQSCCAHMRPLVDCGRPCVLCTIVRSTMNFDFNKNRLGIKHFASKMVDYHKIWMILFFLFSFCKIVKCEFQNIQKWKSRPCALWAIARSAMGAFCIAKCYNCVAKMYFCKARHSHHAFYGQLCVKQ